jgi:hypothetical protein
MTGLLMLIASFVDPVKVFGCRPDTNDAAGSGGRRRKTSKGGNRDEGTVGGSAGTMGI